MAGRGDDPASAVYVRNKIRACEQCGIRSFGYVLSAETTQDELLALVDELNVNPEVDGILVQLPLPDHIDEVFVTQRIIPAKDVDGFNYCNIGRLAQARPTVSSCTPYGVMRLLEEYSIPVCGKNAVVIGRSNIVGKPMAMMLCNADATVTLCHSRTRDLAEITRRADIVVVAIGKPAFLTGDMIKEGAVVIDVGINKQGERLVGDVDYDSVMGKASYLTPVPGGVGPMTIASLMNNVLVCAYAE